MGTILSSEVTVGDCFVASRPRDGRRRFILTERTGDGKPEARSAGPDMWHHGWAMTEAQWLAILRGDDPAEAARAEAELWSLWCRSGDADLDRLLREGVEAMEHGDLEGAEAAFARIIEQARGFAEGWNKRATVRYLAGSYEGSIADCRETLARNPHHFGALSGQGLCHMALGQHREAADCFRRALAVHPHLVAARRNLAVALAESVKGNGHGGLP